ncbi:hypothetical protein NL676_012887 [Syzygium grande]|nr:hypothetical protein NL676_012887 [Syzygium grande]
MIRRDDDSDWCSGEARGGAHAERHFARVPLARGAHAPSPPARPRRERQTERTAFFSNSGAFRSSRLRALSEQAT